MVSVVIGLYKRLDNLKVVLKGLSCQSHKDFEVIVAEDDNAKETLLFLEKARSSCAFPIKHVRQEDRGFRKCRILNKAVRQAAGEVVVFLDGDCIPHKHLVKNYSRLVNEGTICCGRRVMLSPDISQAITSSASIRSLNLCSLTFSKSTKIKHAIYVPFIAPVKNSYWILGCNWGAAKKDLLAVNGFDMDYEIIGVGEDHDIEWRLRGMGITIRKVTQCCITYHLHHQERYNGEVVAPNMKMLRKKQSENQIFCLHGINQLDEGS
jgi:GT2 family glycosyltransferase